MPEMMTVAEIAEYLRIKERKVYDLIAQKQIPCTRVMGKWLFPKHSIDLWLMQNSEMNIEEHHFRNLPAVIVGSHDPLLEWALRENGSPFALQITGSQEGLSRFAAGEAMLCGMHVLDSASGEYNVPLVKTLLPQHDVVVLEWAWRQQGLVVAAGNPLSIRNLTDVAEKQAVLIDRQEGSGSKALLEHLLTQEGISREQLKVAVKPARSETDIGMIIAHGKADAGIAVAAVAKQLRLDFIPLKKERFDLVIRRRDYFEAPMQQLLTFIRTAAFREQAEELGGYDIGGLGKVVYNS